MRRLLLVGCILVILLSACGLKLPDQINLPTQLTGGDPQTLDAATKAAQELADRRASGDFAGVWEMMSKQVRDNISQADWVTESSTCEEFGLPIKVVGVRMEGSTTAIVREGLDGVKLGEETRTMTYEDGKWVMVPTPKFVAELGKPVDQIIADEKADGSCSKAASSPPMRPTSPPGPICSESDPDGQGGCLPWSPGLPTPSGKPSPEASQCPEPTAGSTTVAVIGCYCYRGSSASVTKDGTAVYCETLANSDGDSHYWSPVPQEIPAPDEDDSLSEGTYVYVCIRQTGQTLAQCQDALSQPSYRGNGQPIG
jgi:hypothetical protein